MSKIMNNVVPKDRMREIQSDTLNELSNILKLSFGPNGSNACIKKEDAFSRYTKDGHTIIGSINYNGIIEQSIKDDIESITRHIVKTVGDGTTSAVILSSIIFDEMIDLEEEYDYKPNKINYSIKKVVNEIKENIKNKSRELTLDDVYDIAMISTNSNVDVSNILKSIYGEFGNSVFIDVTPSTGEKTVIKSYNGMTLGTGYCDSCYVTNAKNNTSEIDNPEVYFFEHPVDTRELGVYLDSILSKNIITPCNSGKYDTMIPTVIFAPTISQDMSSIMDSLTSTMASMPVNNRLPICIITSYEDTERLYDLAKMCGAKMIRKYIDPKTYASDVEAGRAPTPETIFNWAGKCDRVVAYSDKTVFIRPHEMFNEDGTYSSLYDNMVAFLESEIKKSIDNGENIRDVGKLKRRLHSLKSNMVELLVGGITQADRDALRDLVEDAVLNVRSAANNGVGYAANMSAFITINEMCKEKNIDTEYCEDKIDYFDTDFKKIVHNMSKCIDKNTDDDSANLSLDDRIIKIIYDAYCNLIDCLFIPEGVTHEDIIKHYEEDGTIYNINEGNYNTNVISSIMSDITILDTVTRIISIMATCNQFIVPTAMHNVYVD